MEMKIGVSFLFQFSILPDFNKAYKASLPLPTRVQFLSCCEVLCSVLIRCHFGTHQRPKFHKREGRRENPNLLTETVLVPYFSTEITSAIVTLARAAELDQDLTVNKLRNIG